MTRRRQNRIVWIKDDRGQWISDEDELKSHAVNFLIICTRLMLFLL